MTQATIGLPLLVLGFSSLGELKTSPKTRYGKPHEPGTQPEYFTFRNQSQQVSYAYFSTCLFS